ncbi:MAG: HEAT repeat domain-containing protein [Myxococcota bacterium]
MHVGKRLLWAVVLSTLLVSLSWFQNTRAAQTQKSRFHTKRQVLKHIVKKPKLLINIHRRLFPATWDLTLLGQKATPALQHGLLGNTRWYVRWKCAQILTQLRDASSRDTLHRALNDWNATVRSQVLRALADFGNSSSIPFLIKRLKDPQESDWNRVLALQALGRLGDARAVRTVIAHYKIFVKKPAIRRAAIRALWNLRPVVERKQMLRWMRKALDDQDQIVVRRAAIALGHLRDQEAITALGKHLLGPSKQLRNVSAHVLGEIGNPKAMPVLIKALSFVRSGRMLNNITFALQKLGDPKLDQRLQGFLQHQQAFIRMNAAYTVGDMRLQKAQKRLEEMLQDPNLIVRNQAIIALAKLKNPRSIAALRDVAQKSKGLPQWLAILGILHISEGREGREMLYEQLRSRLSYQRRRAAYVLTNFQDPTVVPHLFYLMNRRYSARAWRLARKQNNPLLKPMIANQFKTRIHRSSSYQLGQFLDYLKPSVLREHKKALLALLLQKWYRPASLRYPDRVSRRYGRGYTTLVKLIKVLGSMEDAQLRTWLTPFTHHIHYDVRTEARIALARMGDAQSLKNVIKELYNTSDRHRPYLVKRLQSLPQSTLQTAIQPHLKDPDPFVQLALRTTLLRAGDHKQLPILLESLRHRTYSIRQSAYRYLAHSFNAKHKSTIADWRKTEKDAYAIPLLDALLAPKSSAPPEFAYFAIRQVELR